MKKTGPRFPLLLTTGRILSQYNVGAQTRRTRKRGPWHEQDLLEIHPHDAENRGLNDGDYVKLASRSGETTLRAKITDRVSPAVWCIPPSTTPTRRPNVITTDYSDWGHELSGIQGHGGAGQPLERAKRVAGRFMPHKLRRHAAFFRRQSDGRARSISASPACRSSPTGLWQCIAHYPKKFAVAMVFDGSSAAVMMATPADVQDLALGFALSEGIVSAPDQFGRV